MKKLEDLDKVELLKYYDQLINDVDIKSEKSLENALDTDATIINECRFLMINSIKSQIFKSFCILVDHLNHIGKLIFTPNFIDNEHIQTLNFLIKIKLHKKHITNFFSLNKDILQLCLIAEYFRRNCDLLDVMSWSSMINFNSLKLDAIKIKKINFGALVKDLMDLNQIEVTSLDLSCCSIELIEPWSEATCGYRYLKNLDLSNNNITILDEKCFDYLFCLESMSLSDNKIKKIAKDCFIKLTRLKKLELNNNCLKSVHFEGNDKLEYLDLSENLIENIKENNFRTFKNLEILNLNSNKLFKIENQTFIYLENLKQLYLRKNFIIELENNCFDCLSDLKKIDLGYNEIDSIKVKMFKKLSKFNSLIIDGNKNIKIEENFFQKLSNLKVLIT